ARKLEDRPGPRRARGDRADPSAGRGRHVTRARRRRLARQGAPRLPDGERPVRADRPSVFGSPVLVGAITVLVVVVGVFLAYNANKGLPFVPTYDVNARVPNAADLVVGNDVRVGGDRVGVVNKITPERHADGTT